MAYEAPLSVGFSRQEYCSGLPSSLGDLPDPGIKPRSPALLADSLPSEPPGKSIILYVSVKKQRHYFVNKGLSSQGYVFSSGPVWMLELDCEES